MPKLYKSLSGSVPAQVPQQPAPVPSAPADLGAGPSLFQGLQQPMDLDGFPVGTPAGVKAVMSPQEYMARHPQAPAPMPTAPPQAKLPQSNDLSNIAADFVNKIKAR